MNRILKVAVVGASFAHSPDGRENFSVKAHLPALLAQPERFEVVAVCTRREESARETAAHFNIPGAFHNLDAMLTERPDIDMVSVAVRPSSHFDVVMKLLGAGKHVYCEHPLGTTTEQARGMYALARDRGLHTAVGYQGHFQPGARRMAQLIRDGYIGKPLTFHISTFVSNYIVPRPGHRQWLFQSEIGGHPGYRSGRALERLLAMLDADVTEICAQMDIKAPERINVETGGVLRSNQVDTSIYLVRLAGGISGTLQVSYAAWFGSGERAEIYGTEGMLLLHSSVPTENWQQASDDSEPAGGGVRLYGARVDIDAFVAHPVSPERLVCQYREIPVPIQPVTRLPQGRQSYAVAEAFAEFHRAIVNGTPFAPSFTEGLKIHCILDASERSSEDRGWAAVDYGSL